MSFLYWCICFVLTFVTAYTLVHLCSYMFASAYMYALVFVCLCWWMCINLCMCAFKCVGVCMSVLVRLLAVIMFLWNDVVCVLMSCHLPVMMATTCRFVTVA